MLTARYVAAAVTACLIVALVSGPGPQGLPADGRSWVLSVVFTVLGLRFVGHAPRNAVGWLLLAMAASAAITVLVASAPRLWPAAWIGSWAWIPAYTLLPALALVFPTGHPPTPRWSAFLTLNGLGALLMAVGLGAAAWTSPTTFWSEAFEGRIERGWATAAIALGLALIGVSALGAIASLAARWRRKPDLRGMLAWALGSTVLTVAAATMELVGVPAVWWLAALALPAATVVAVVRYGLFDIDLLIHRSLLYGGLSVALLALYGAVTLAVAGVAPGQAEAAAAVAAVLAVLPLRTLVQRRLDRWLHGDRADPYAALSRLGHRLEESLGLDEVLPTIAAQVATALKAPYVRVRLATDSPRGTVEIGRRRHWPTLSIPLSFRGGRIGDLTLESRAPDERYDTRERRLLSDLARNVAAAAHAVVLTEDLRLARERLVLAREEERRRLRRDLHDGVGAGLAGVLMQVRAAAQRLDETSPARPLLQTATADLGAATQEVRRVVDGLRPAVLDQGLAGALRAQAAQYTRAGLDVDLQVLDDLAHLPAAVEVAAFHLAGEALANAARHASATRCEVTVAVQRGGLHLDVVDDGTGLIDRGRTGADTRLGVGMTSMQERATELGGTLHVAAAQPSGTRVSAWLPFPDTVTGPPESQSADAAEATPSPVPGGRPR